MIVVLSRELMADIIKFKEISFTLLYPYDIIE